MTDELYAEPGKIRIFPITEGSCPVCGAVHERSMPHYRGSVYYVMRFQQMNGRMPVWKDAMAHCPKQVQKEFARYLREAGITEDEIYGEVKHNRELRKLPMEQAAGRGGTDLLPADGDYHPGKA